MPAPSREDARLLRFEPATRRVSHHGIRDLPGLLRSGDVLVVNESRVLPARLRLVKSGTGGLVEALVLSGWAPPGEWTALLNGAAVRPGVRLAPEAAPDVPVFEVGERLAGGGWRMAVVGGASPLETFGTMPLPPYIERTADPDLAKLDRERYQTVFARDPGSIAAPTAGLHLTDGLLAALAGGGVQVARVTLHVGPGTFRPVTAAKLEDHRMDPEPFVVPAAASVLIEAALREGRRIVAVGTTCTRTLESVGPEGFTGAAVSGSTGLFITPGYRFRVVGGLLTNFHLPRSTPYALVAALIGLDGVRSSYTEAVRERYRFLSYGDAMLIA